VSQAVSHDAGRAISPARPDQKKFRVFLSDRARFERCHGEM
jgi:hypothetical protein